MKNRILGILIFLLVIGGFVFFKNKTVSNPIITYTEEKPFYGTIQDIVSTTGTVEPQNRLEIIPPISGRVEKIYVQEGDVVRSGQTLAEMSSADRAALLDAAESQGKEKVKYWSEVYKPTVILSPINGKVIVRDIEPGQTINTSTALLVLADRLIVNAQVDETDIGQVKVGQKVIISLDAYPNVKISGRVIQISYESETVNNVTIYEVKIISENVPGIFRSGMNANVNIIKLQKNKALLLSEKAITYKNEQPTVLIKDNSPEGFHTVKIKTGLSQNGNMEIVSGLKDTDTVLIASTTTVSAKKTVSSFISMGRPRSGSKQQRPPQP
jgi:macrolide-specific efflux system membrane fusion protein